MNSFLSPYIYEIYLYVRIIIIKKHQCNSHQFIINITIISHYPVEKKKEIKSFRATDVTKIITFWFTVFNYTTCWDLLSKYDFQTIKNVFFFFLHQAEWYYGLCRGTSLLMIILFCNETKTNKIRKFTTSNNVKILTRV